MDRDWASDEGEDQHARARAVRCLLRIGEEEAARRAEHAADLHDGYHPGHNPDGLDLQDCPVCGYEAFSASSGDEHGMGVGIGECLVCHYERSPATAAREARVLLYEARGLYDE